MRSLFRKLSSELLVPAKYAAEAQVREAKAELERVRRALTAMRDELAKVTPKDGEDAPSVLTVQHQRTLEELCHWLRETGEGPQASRLCWEAWQFLEFLLENYDEDKIVREIRLVTALATRALDVAEEWSVDAGLKVSDDQWARMSGKERTALHAPDPARKQVEFERLK